LTQWISKFRTDPGYLQLPRFKMESKLELQKPLSELGMGIAFSDKANFSSLSTRPVQINQVIHKTFVEVNESGTTAAAATAIGITSTLVEAVKTPFDMKVNQPFLDWRMSQSRNRNHPVFSRFNSMMSTLNRAVDMMFNTRNIF